MPAGLPCENSGEWGGDVRAGLLPLFLDSCFLVSALGLFLNQGLYFFVTTLEIASCLRTSREQGLGRKLLTVAVLSVSGVSQDWAAFGSASSLSLENLALRECLLCARLALQISSHLTLREPER